MSEDKTFLKDWSKLTSKPLVELNDRFDNIYKELVENGVDKEEAFEESQRILFIELKSDMQSSAEGFIGMIYGYTNARDWTVGIRAKAMQKYKDMGDSAIGKYVIIDEARNVKPLFFTSKDENKRTQVLEPSLIRNICGMCMKRDHFAIVEILNDIIQGKLKPKEEYDADFDKWSTLTKEQATAKLTKLWEEFRWFEMTISNNYADEKDEKFISMPDLFRPVSFRAIDKTETQPYYILNASSKTIFEPTKKLELTNIQIKTFIKGNPRFCKIANLETVFAQRSNFYENPENKTQTTQNFYITEGSVSGDLAVSPYSDILKLDDITLGFETDKSVTMFLPKGMANFGKGSRIMVVGQLTRKFDDKAKKYAYPSIQVAGIFVLKLVKMVTQESIKAIQEVAPEVISNTKITEKTQPKPTEPEDVAGAVPIEDSWGGL